VIIQAINRADDRLATKDDLTLVESGLRGEMNELGVALRGEMNERFGAFESSVDRRFAEARHYMEERFAALEVEVAEMRGQIEALRSQLGALKWVVGLNMAMTAAVLFRLFFAFP